MSNIHYLRPREQPDRNDGQQPESPRLRIAMSQAHLAAVLMGETVTRNGIVPAKVSAFLERLTARAGGSALTSKPSLAAGQPRLPLPGLQRTVTRTPPSSDSSGFANAVGASVDAFIVIAVISGTIQFNTISQGASESQQAALRLKSAYIGVPDDILLAREKSTQQVVFSINSFEVLSETVSDILRQKRHMIENWAVMGGRPALNLRYQARTPFGRMAHRGADASSDLRGVAVRASRETGPWESFYLLELSLTPRTG